MRRNFYNGYEPYAQESYTQESYTQEENETERYYEDQEEIVTKIIEQEESYNQGGWGRGSCGECIQVEIEPYQTEIKIDANLSKHEALRIWGRVTEPKGKAIADALVQLIRPIRCGDEIEYISLAHTITDCMGFYQFEVYNIEATTKLRIIISKPTVCKI